MVSQSTESQIRDYLTVNNKNDDDLVSEFSYLYWYQKESDILGQLACRHQVRSPEFRCPCNKPITSWQQARGGQCKDCFERDKKQRNQQRTADNVLSNIKCTACGVINISIGDVRRRRPRCFQCYQENKYAKKRYLI